jgi:hypothetical protein
MYFALGAVMAASADAGEAVNAPSKLDYLVLASFVTSPHLLSMASYRSTARQPAAGPPGASQPGARPAAPGQLPAGIPGAGAPAPGVARP